MYDEAIKIKSSHTLLFLHTGIYGAAQVCTQAHSRTILTAKLCLRIIILYHNFSVIRICSLGAKFSCEITLSSSKEGKEEEKTGFSASCLPGAGYPHTPLSTGLAVKAQPGPRTVKSLQKKSHVIHLYRQQGGLIPPQVHSSAAAYCLYEITVRL